MSHMVYYIRGIPENKSTARYNHALAIGKGFNESILVTHRDPPSEIAELYTDCYILERSTNISEEIKRTYYSSFLLRELISNYKINMIISTFHYSQVFASFISTISSSIKWAVDVYDHPMQLAWGNPSPNVHAVSSRVLCRTISSADIGINSFHPSAPFAFGKKKTYLTNGAPVDDFNFQYGDFEDDMLRGVVVGKTRLSDGMKTLIDSLKHVKSDIIIDVYGEPIQKTKKYAQSMSLGDTINFHGYVDHSTIKSKIQESDVGFCVLPPRDDFLYSYPIKCGEYMAAGTIPFVSDHPSLRDFCGKAAIFTEFEPKKIANNINNFMDHSLTEKRTMSDKARSQAEKMAWSKKRSELIRSINNNM